MKLKTIALVAALAAGGYYLWKRQAKSGGGGPLRLTAQFVGGDDWCARK